MKKFKTIMAASLLAVLSFSSCIEHEVIPAPTPTVDLTCSFIGTINSTTVEYTENVLGYYCNTSKAKILLPPPSLSSAVYYSEILSSSNPGSIKIGLGSVFWDASLTSEPALTTFNNFHLNNSTPAFSNSGANGFEVTYKDASGINWVSKQTSMMAQNAAFTGILQESDANGDYSKFTCNFNCYVYHQDAVTMLWDSLSIQNAQFKAWFQR